MIFSCFRLREKAKQSQMTGSLGMAREVALFDVRYTLTRSPTALELITDPSSLRNSFVFHHQGHDIDQKISSCDTGNLCNSIVWRADLDNISTNQIDTLQAFDEAFQLSCRPPA
jgi:hypothetical protein